VLWTYETVAEPTGVASNYWDANPPRERATKRRAKEKMLALKEYEVETQGEGLGYGWVDGLG
jgi:hypothetical protein